MRITKLLKGKEIGKSIVAAGCTCNTCTCSCSCCWGGGSAEVSLQAN
ncbi:hypothetical protein [Neolewinella aurantiaca]|nr:hypothetical protein [Neolewinella aurantiaca]